MIQVGNKKVRGIYINKEIIQTIKTSDKIFVTPASATINDSTSLSKYFNCSAVDFSGSMIRIYEGGTMKSKNPITNLYIGIDGRNTGQWYNNMMVYEINIKPADTSLSYGYNIKIKNSFTGNSTLSEYTIYDYKTGKTHIASGEPVEVDYTYKGTGRIRFQYDVPTKTYTLQIATTSGDTDLTLSATTDYFIPMYIEIKGLSEISDDVYSNINLACLKGYRVD